MIDYLGIIKSYYTYIIDAYNLLFTHIIQFAELSIFFFFFIF